MIVCCIGDDKSQLNKILLHIVDDKTEGKMAEYSTVYECVGKVYRSSLDEDGSKIDHAFATKNLPDGAMCTVTSSVDD